MAGGKIQHWKHGWIPLTPAALRSKLKQGPPPKGNRTGGTLTNAERRKIANLERAAKGEKPLPARGRVPSRGRSQADRISDTLSRGRPVNAEAKRAEDRMKAREMAPDVDLTGRFSKESRERRMTYARHDVVDGVEFVSYAPGKDPMGIEHGLPYEFTDAQREVLADAYNRVMKDFPGAEPVQIVGVDDKSGAFGITSWDGRRISISSELFDDARRKGAGEAWGVHGAIAGPYAANADAFARATMIHELGHALHMQKADVRRAGEQMAFERVQPADVGIFYEPHQDKPDPFTRFRPSEVTSPRWQIDTLDNQSAYATANQYEWFAEAFADGWLNKAGATPSGKRALDLIRQSYGGQQKVEEAA